MCDSERAEAVSGEPPVIQLQEHSNANLLKIDTHDKYSTASAIKRLIRGALPEGPSETTPQPLLKGLLRINKNPKNPCVFFAFATPEDRTSALALLQTIKHRGRSWVEVPVTSRDLNLTHKGGGGVKRPRSGDGDAASSGGSKVAQYEHLPLDQQLERKKRHCLDVMKAIVPPRIFGWDAYAKRFLGVYTSAITEGYRNHVNLSFGLAEDGSPALGFQKGALVEGTAAIEPATLAEKNVVTMHAIAKVAATALMEICMEFYPAERGGLQVYDKIKAAGFWRKLQVRHNVRAEVMMDIELDTGNVADEVLEQVKQKLRSVFSSRELLQRLRDASGLDTATVVSLQYHTHSGNGSIPYEAPRHVVFGAATLTEYLAGLEYELSPTAFFQVNTPGMELMLSHVQEVAGLTKGTTLLDLCSGTGTIGLTLASHVKRVVGIELVESAVENARRNAERNGIANAEFHCGRVEALLPSVINGLSVDDRKDIVAILDPPRAGVNSSVLKWIRGTETIRRVVYISCEQKALERDCPGLMKPCTKAYRGDPFEVTAAFAVDLFPHTHHVEMVAVLTRCSGVALQQNGEAEDGDASDAETAASEENAAIAD